ncbi:hypothetical protein [Streptomyces sp. NBC_00893]|nr:hypothetical protein [Streptomyces sp. NBC_00893]MCX4851238.1 hypothetical protein [Streptomyces sp. NBC_00893]
MAGPTEYVPSKPSARAVVVGPEIGSRSSWGRQDVLVDATYEPAGEG